jgi:hypothetical protein
MNSFVETEGTEFVVSGEPYVPTGVNNFWISYQYIDQETVHEIMSEAAEMGLNTLRVWGFGEGKPQRYQPTPGEYNAEAFRRMDHILQEARKHGIRLVVPFVDNWSYFGGMDQYVEWSDTADEHDDFYTDATTRQLYKDYVHHFLTRENTLTGVQYRNDPTVLMWELANEPHCPSDVSGETLQNWIEEMAAFVKGIDGNHLLSTGSDGYYADPNSDQYGTSQGVDFVPNHRPATIDACSFHLYDYFGGEYTEKGVDWIDRHTADAHDELDMPVYLGEFGREVDRDASNAGEQLQTRNRTYERWYEAMAGAGTNGALVWQLVGDSEFEESDAYGVFYPRDESTADVIETGARRLVNSKRSDVVGETDSVTVTQSDSSQWHTVQLADSYEKPVVVMQPATRDGPDPVHVRLRAVTSTGFEFQLEEWDYDDGGHTSETVSYVVVEAGRHTLSDGTAVEAGAVRADDSFTSVGFAGSFDAAPVALSQAQTRNGSDAVVTRQRDVSTDGFDVRVQESEANGAHTTERVGYIAIESGSGSLDGVKYDAGTTSNAVTDERHRLGFAHDYGDPPAFVAGMQTQNGADPAGLRHGNLSGSSVSVHIEEEASDDSETTHTSETVGYLTFAAPGTFRAATLVGEAATATVSQSGTNQWHTVRLDGSYENPIVVAQPPSTDGGDPVHVRLRAVTSTSFEFQLEEWDYDDGGHTSETVSYVVVEAGRHTLSDGTAVEAGAVRADDSFTSVGFAGSFDAAPVALSQAQTRNGSDAVVTRQRDVSTDGFDVRVQESEANGAHTTERVGYIAIESGSGTNGDTSFEAGRTGNTVTDERHTVGLDHDLGAAPVFLAGMQTADGPDTAGLRYRSLDGTSVDALVDEERSDDSETSHTTETIGYVLLTEECHIYANG